MTSNPNQPSQTRPGSNNIDSIAGATIGSILAKFGQNLPDHNAWKGYIIVFAPAIGIIIRYLWHLLAPEAVFYIRRKFNKYNRRRLYAQADELLNDPRLSEKNKAKVRAKIEDAQLSAIEELIQHIKKTMSAD